MTVSRNGWRYLAVVFTVFGIAAWGCGTSNSTPTADAPSAGTSDDHDHSHDGAHDHSHDDASASARSSESAHAPGHQHGNGPHAGTLADWGGGKYHVEFTVDHDQQQAIVYVLGADEKTPSPISATEGKLLLTITEPAFQVELSAAPMDGESADRASRYVGKHEKLGVVQEFAGTISGEVAGTPFAGDFQEEAHGDHDHAKPAPTKSAKP